MFEEVNTSWLRTPPRARDAEPSRFAVLKYSSESLNSFPTINMSSVLSTRVNSYDPWIPQRFYFPSKTTLESVRPPCQRMRESSQSLSERSKIRAHGNDTADCWRRRHPSTGSQLLALGDSLPGRPANFGYCWHYLRASEAFEGYRNIFVWRSTPAPGSRGDLDVA